MSYKINPAERAFPAADNGCWQFGMTIRTWLAGQALAGVCADDPSANHQGRAEWCVEAADAVIDALNKQPAGDAGS